VCSSDLALVHCTGRALSPVSRARKRSSVGFVLSKRRLPLGPEVRKLNGWQFRALLTEGGVERVELARA
jgi:hypothetical protein